MKTCWRYLPTGRHELRDGTLSDYCRRCGKPSGYHRPLRSVVPRFSLSDDGALNLIVGLSIGAFGGAYMDGMPPLIACVSAAASVALSVAVVCVIRVVFRAAWLGRQKV